VHSKVISCFNINVYLCILINSEVFRDTDTEEFSCPDCLFRHSNTDIFYNHVRRTHYDSWQRPATVRRIRRTIDGLPKSEPAGTSSDPAGAFDGKVDADADDYGDDPATLLPSDDESELLNSDELAALPLSVAKPQSLLESLGFHVDTTHRALICPVTTCACAIHPDVKSILKHIKKHDRRPDLPATTALSSELAMFQLLDPDEIPVPPKIIARIPFLGLLDGFSCIFLDCTYLVLTRRAMLRHLHAEHHCSIPRGTTLDRVSVQRWTHGNHSPYFRVYSAAFAQLRNDELARLLEMRMQECPVKPERVLPHTLHDARDVYPGMHDLKLHDAIVGVDPTSILWACSMVVHEDQIPPHQALITATVKRLFSRIHRHELDLIPSQLRRIFEDPHACVFLFRSFLFALHG